MKAILCVVVFVALCSQLGQAADTCKHANKKIGEDIQFKDLGINCVLPLCCLYKNSEAYARDVEAPLSPLAQSFNKMSLADKNLYCMVFMMSKPQIPSCGTLVAGLSDFRGNAKTNYIDTAHALMAHSLENVNDALFGKSEAHWIVPLYNYMRTFYFSAKSLCRTPDDLQSYISTLNPPKPDSVYSVGSWAIKPDAKTDLLIAADVIKTAAGCIGIEINDKKFTSFTCTELISMIGRVNQGPSPFWMNKGNIPYPLAHLMPEINRVVKQLYADAVPKSFKDKPKLTLSKPNFGNCEKEPTITFSCMDFTPIYEKKSSEAGKCNFSD